VHVVILAAFEHDEYIFDGLRAGAAGFRVMNTDQAGLVRPAGRRQLLWAASLIPLIS